jgi:hypothetical protein
MGKQQRSGEVLTAIDIVRGRAREQERLLDVFFKAAATIARLDTALAEQAAVQADTVARLVATGWPAADLASVLGWTVRAVADVAQKPPGADHREVEQRSDRAARHRSSTINTIARDQGS